MSVLDSFIEGLSKRHLEHIRPLFEPDAVWWSNISGRNRTIDDYLAALELEDRHVSEMQIVEVGRLSSDEGYALRIEARGRTEGGAEFLVPICFIITVVGGRITRLDEYLSADHVRPILQEMYGS